MELSADEQDMMDGRRGPVLQFAIELLQRVGSMHGARRLQPIEAAYVNTCFSGTPSHLDFMTWIHDQGARVAVPTYTNVGGWDARNPDIRVDPDVARFNDNSRHLMRLHSEIGCTLSITCAPYQLPSCPKSGVHVACSESNAVSYFNSVCGVRTEKYGDYIDMAAALTGRVPAFGLHLEEARRGTLIIEVQKLPASLWQEDLIFQLIGFVVGRRSDKHIPVIEGLEPCTQPDNLRSVCASAASSGAVAMYHAIGLTPEAPDIETATQGQDCPRISVSLDDLTNARQEMQGFTSGTINAVAIGTPHASLSEIEALDKLLDGRKIADHVSLFVQVNRFVHGIAKQKGWIDSITATGGTFVTDTCLYWRPTTRGLEGRVMTTSGKFAYYSPGELNLNCRIATLRECVESAVIGEVWVDRDLALAP